LPITATVDEALEH